MLMYALSTTFAKANEFASELVAIGSFFIHCLLSSLPEDSETRGIGSAFHQLCPRYCGTLSPTVPRLLDYGKLNLFYLLLSYTYFVINRQC